MNVRRLGSDDLLTMRSLNRLFGEAFEDRTTYEGSAPDDDYLRAILTNTGNIALVAEDGEELVGGLFAYELDKFEQVRREVYIYDLAVTASRRREGIGRALLTSIGELAKQRGAWAVFVQADVGDEAAIALYRSFGEAECVLHFDVWLKG